MIKTATIGDNSKAFTEAELKQFVERCERLNEEKAALSNDLRDVYVEMRGRGYDDKVVRHIVKMRKQDHAKVSEFEALLDVYKLALGMG